MLFEASWIWREAGRPLPAARHALRWERASTAAQLAAFERAWRGEDTNSAAAPTVTQFPATLLEKDTVTFLAGMSDARRVEGVAIVNRTGEVAGLSNVFGAATPIDELWTGAVHAAVALHPDCALVGYERGEDLTQAQRLGFEEVGRLRVVVIEGGVQ